MNQTSWETFERDLLALNSQLLTALSFRASLRNLSGLFSACMRSEQLHAHGIAVLRGMLVSNCLSVRPDEALKQAYAQANFREQMHSMERESGYTDRWDVALRAPAYGFGSHVVDNEYLARATNGVGRSVFLAAIALASDMSRFDINDVYNSGDRVRNFNNWSDNELFLRILEEAKSDKGSSAKTLFSKPLFSDQSLKEQYSALPEWTGMTFWREWFAGHVRGKPLSWELQRAVALIDDEVWDQQVEIVEHEINAVWKHYELQTTIGKLQDTDASHISKSRHSIGGNNPPENMQIEPQIVRETTIIWAAVDELKAETETEAPDKSTVLRIIETLGRALKAILAWCAQKGDLSVDTLIKWGIPIGGAAVLANPKLVSDVIEAAKAWATFLP